MKIVIVGGSFAGIQAAIQARKNDAHAEIILLEKQPMIGFIPGSLSLYLQGKVKTLTDCQWITKERLKTSFAIDVRCGCCCLGFANETQLKLSCGGNIHFDVLIIATGSGQFSRYLQSKPAERIHTFKTKSCIQKLLKQLKTSQKIGIIGAGQVGLELAESLVEKGKEVHLFESNSAILFRYLDPEMSISLVEKIRKSGVYLHLDEPVQSLDEKNHGVFVAAKTKEWQMEQVLLANSSRPDNQLWEEDLLLNEDGTIWVDTFLQTSRKRVFAIGDAIQVRFQITGEPIYVSLVNNAIRTARVAVQNLKQPTLQDRGTLRTMGNYFFGYFVGSTGLTEAESIFYKPSVKVVYEKQPIDSLTDAVFSSKLIFSAETGCLLGAQIISSRPCFGLLNQLAQAIQQKSTQQDLAQLETFYQPKFAYPYSFFDQLGDTYEN